MTLPTTDELMELGDVVKNITFWSFCMLGEAYKNATSNEECAKILRLFCTDFKEFEKEYATHGEYYSLWQSEKEKRNDST